MKQLVNKQTIKYMYENDNRRDYVYKDILILNTFEHALQVKTYQNLLEPLLRKDETGLVLMPELFYVPKDKVSFPHVLNTSYYLFCLRQIPSKVQYQALQKMHC